MNTIVKYYFLGLVAIFIIACHKEKPPEKYIWKALTVKVTAYNSLAYQTSSNPVIAAWGDSLKPGMKYIAVSRDLLKLGLVHNTPIKIEGLEGVYLVKDKMNRRWKNRIDLYMGVDVKKAKQWGVKRLKIYYGIPKDSLPNTSIH